MAVRKNCIFSHKLERIKIVEAHSFEANKQKKVHLRDTFYDIERENLNVDILSKIHCLVFPLTRHFKITPSFLSQVSITAETSHQHFP